MSVISRQMSHVYLAICQNMFSPVGFGGYQGVSPMGFALASFPSSSMTLIHIWCYINMSNLGHRDQLYTQLQKLEPLNMYYYNFCDKSMHLGVNSTWQMDAVCKNYNSTNTKNSQSGSYWREWAEPHTHTHFTTKNMSPQNWSTVLHLLRWVNALGH
jgi:hypothetical protein